MPASDYPYWLGKEKEDLKVVGVRGLHRRDADDKATGKAIYGRDVNLHGMLYARVMMSPYAHAKIKSMDTSEAEKLPGVRAVLRYDDPEVPQRIFQPWDPEMYMIYLKCVCVPFSILGSEAFYEGALVGVAIAADSLDIADEAMELVKVEWEVKDFVIDYEKALEPGAPIAYDYLTSYDPSAIFPFRMPFGGAYGSEEFAIRPTGWDNINDATNIKSVTDFSLPGTDLEAGFAEADQTIEFTFKRTEIIGYGPEILSTTAQWMDNGDVGIWQAGEFPPKVDFYSAVTGIPADKFQIHSPYAGGQFGGWDANPVCPQGSQIPIAALLSKKAEMPVKVVFKRKDEQYAEMDEGVFNIKVGFKNDGTITAAQIDSITSLAADIAFIPDTCGGGHLFESTKIPNWGGACTSTFLNKHTFGPSRCEQQINAKVKNQIFTRVAAVLGMDEGVIATVNDGQEGHDMAWASEFKKQVNLPDIDSLSIVLEAGKDAIGWDEKYHAPGEKMLPNGKLHGMCLFANHEFSNGVPPDPINSIAAYPHLNVDHGKIYMVAERPDCGVDGRTGYTRIVAEEMGMNFEDVKYTRISESTPSQPKSEFIGGGGSRVFIIQTWPVVVAARLLKKKMLSAAAAVLEIDVDDLDIVDSMVVQKSKPSNTHAIEEIPSLEGITALWADANYTELGMPGPVPVSMPISRCVNIVEVEVDPETGEVDVTNAVAVNDVGQPIGPETCEGQMYGGAIMGYSTSAIEEVIYDPSTGVRLNPNFLDYKIMTMLDAPEVKYEMVTSRMGYGPYGSCGVGEDNCTFGSAMIIPAVHNAIGKWVDTYPPTPERVLKALGKA